jgi:nitrogen PTS system EIIA component
MADEDFGIESLAAYLHLDAAQVLRLAERGRLPGRKVGGQWRFAPGEIHHWLEQRIGISSDLELIHMEGALERAGPGDEEPVSIATLLPLQAIAVPLPARTRSSVMASVVEQAARTGWLWDVAKMIEAVRTREDMVPTALDNGVALLHPRRPQANLLAQPFIAFGRTERGIPFGAPRGALTDLFFLICSIDDRGHLQTLARLSRIIGEPDLLSALRTAPNAQAVHDAIRSAETKLSDALQR